ncbi:hypothetical protein [Streptomyces sp. NBC_00557]|uniref:hypothetical protein n=1 Tax=Streptomyces sp. NBC_00557 TaxID=2975776 RepID=UPI002E81C369|nr:hypothetical protein [Streptomyces sp. NBC_00557]WUC33884.1 hypothetical protein OG956_06535 [Streptomyces sp. NBC_00557]
MAVERLPGGAEEFAGYLDGLLARLDQDGGWSGVFWRRDPDGLRACLDGREVPPWDVVEALLEDLAAAYGPAAAAAERERARALHRAALTAHDARPGAREALLARLDVMLREQHRAAERRAALTRRLSLPASTAEAESVRLDLAWTDDDHARATARCAELRSRIAELDLREAERARGERRGGDSAPVRKGGAQAAGEPAPRFRRADPGGRSGERDWWGGASGSGREEQAPAIQATTPDHAPGAVPLAPPVSAPVHGSAPTRVPSARPADAAASVPPAAVPAHAPAPVPSGRPAGTAPTTPPLTRPATTPPPAPPLAAPAPATPQAPAAESAKSRKRRRGSARFAGMAEEQGAAVVPVVPLPAGGESSTGDRAPRGARFAGVGEGAEAGVAAAPGEVVDAEAGAVVAGAVERLARLRAEGRSGEAHVLLVEVAQWPPARFPALAESLQRAGLDADWATLLWETASLAPERLVAAADALVAAGREADARQMLRQGVARPAEEIGAAVLRLEDEGRGREAAVLLDAVVRGRTAQEAARGVAPDPRRLVPLLLGAARAVSDERHWDLVHALRVAGHAT